MAAKRVADVSADYESTQHGATNTEIGRIRKLSKPLQTGKLERDVDALLRSKGVRLDETAGGKRLRGPRGRTQG